jgi:hypothetical protein
MFVGSEWKVQVGDETPQNHENNNTLRVVVSLTKVLT